MVSNAHIIIDLKPVSPQYGDLFRGRDPVEEAKKLEKAGVLGLSVVTAREHFGGSLDLLRAVTRAVNLPVLRKDFIKTEDDLFETLDSGAAGVLLIAATVPDIGAMYEKALSLGLNPLVEVHTAKEMETARLMGATIIGINNKDILNLEKDGGTVDLTAELIGLAPKNAFIVSESGIRNREDAQRAITSGANAVLVGAAFWLGDFTITAKENR